MSPAPHPPFQLCFHSLFGNGRGYAFPCDARGRVDLDQLPDRMRTNYLFARAMVGRELQVPAVELGIQREAVEMAPA